MGANVNVTEIEKKNVEENLKNNQEIVNLQDELKALREKRDSILINVFENYNKLSL